MENSINTDTEYSFITECPELIKRAEEMYKKGDIVVSLTAPEMDSPFPLWQWYDIIKIWDVDRWRNVMTVHNDSLKEYRTSNKPLRIKE